MMCIIFINILSTVSLDIFVGTVKQIVKFISYLTTVTNSTYSSKVACSVASSWVTALSRQSCEPVCSISLFGVYDEMHINAAAVSLAPMD